MATHVGAVIGAWLYYLAIGNLATAIVRMLIFGALTPELHWQKDDDGEDTEEEEETNSDEAEPLPVKQQYSGDGRAPTYIQVCLPTPNLLFL